MRHLIIGASAAGVAAAEAILSVDPKADVTVVSEEPRPPYCRPLISYWLAREIPESLFALPSPVLSRVDFRAGVRAIALDPRDKRVRLDSGEVLPYDRLLLATGAESKPIGLDGETRSNVFGFRTWQDAEEIESEIANGAARAVVLGGGLVGVKAAQALASRGMEVALCIASDHALSQTVDAEAGAMVARALEAEGVSCHTQSRPTGLETDGNRVMGVQFDPPGCVKACDLVVRGKGVEPRVDLVRGLGFETAGGVPTDPSLRTPLPDVWAAGDAALTFDVAFRRHRLNAIWPMAAEQGALAGRCMAGAHETYPGSLAMNSINVGKLSLISVGVTRPSDPSCEVRADGGSGRGYYRKVVLLDGKIIGAIVAGVDTQADAVAQAGLLVSAIRREARLEDLPFDPLDHRIHWGKYAFSTLPSGN